MFENRNSEHRAAADHAWPRTRNAGVNEFRPSQILIGLLAGATFTASAGNLNARDSEQSGAWTSLVLELGDTRKSRALATAENDDSALITLDSTAGSCDTFSIVVNITGDRYAEKDEVFPDVPVSLHVDKEQVFHVDGSLSQEKGDETSYLTLTNTQLGPVYGQLMTGQYLRMKVKLGGDEYFLRFSLNGAKAAFERQTAPCEGLAAPDAEFFEQTPTQHSPDESDANYF